MASLVDFNKLVDEIMSENGFSTNRPVVEKELLHYDILYALSSAGLLKKITFQGGTLLRLCHGSNRFSEDLDFAGGHNFCSADMQEIKSCIEKYVGHRYGLEVVVKEPSELRKEPEYADVKIDKWQISVTTSAERKDLPKQRIKIEIANIPAYTRALRSLQRNYPQLPDGYSDLLIQAEELSEVMADKLISFPATMTRIRYRDMWDLVWLHQQGVKPNAQLVMKKTVDYKIDNEFKTLLQSRIESLPELVQSKEFNDEIKRFLPLEVVERTLNNQDFLLYLETTLYELMKSVQSDMYGDRRERQSNPFSM